MGRVARPLAAMLLIIMGWSTAGASGTQDDVAGQARPRGGMDVRLAQAAGGGSPMAGIGLPGVTPPGSEPGDLSSSRVSPPPPPDPDDTEGRAIILFQDRRSETSPSFFINPPFGAIGIIVVRFANGREEMGTGFLVDTGVVLTAGHVLFSHDHGAAILARFTPACALLKPDAQEMTGERLRVSTAWRRGRDELEGDYGAMFLPDAKRYARCGAFSIAVVSGEFVERHIARETSDFMIAGFPAEKPLGTMWHEAGALVASRASTVSYTIDTTPGQSGAPLFAAVADPKTGKRVPMAIGIHSRPARTAKANQARLIDADVIRDLKTWSAEMAGKQP